MNQTFLDRTIISSMNGCLKNQAYSNNVFSALSESIDDPTIVISSKYITITELIPCDEVMNKLPVVVNADRLLILGDQFFGLGVGL